MKQTETCISTCNGDFFDFERPEKYSFDINCIGHSLSNLCRYTGHSPGFYSVAEHSVLVSKLLPKELALTGLLHDASEAFCGDVASPLKKMLPEYKRIEETVQQAIAKAFNLPYPFPQEIHDADKAAYRTEIGQFKNLANDKLWYVNVPAVDIEIKFLSPKGAYREFINRYEFLTNDTLKASDKPTRTKTPELSSERTGFALVSESNYPQPQKATAGGRRV